MRPSSHRNVGKTSRLDDLGDPALVPSFGFHCACVVDQAGHATRIKVPSVTGGPIAAKRAQRLDNRPPAGFGRRGSSCRMNASLARSLWTWLARMSIRRLCSPCAWRACSSCLRAGYQTLRQKQTLSQKHKHAGSGQSSEPGSAIFRCCSASIPEGVTFAKVD